MISDDLPAGNTGPGAPTRIPTSGAHRLLLIGAALLLLAGCAAEKQPEPAHETTCAVVLDASVWDPFLSLATRSLDPDQKVELSEWDALFDHPALKTWLSTKKGKMPGRGITKKDVVSWMPLIFTDDPAARQFLRTSTSKMLNIEYTYSFEHADTVASRIAAFHDGDAGCRLRAKLDRWLAPENVPDTLLLHLAPMDQQLIKVKNSYLIDTSLASASTLDQLLNQIAGMVYRIEQALPGPDPQGAQGEAMIAQTWRLLLNDGLLACLQDVHEMTYARDHRRLHKFKSIPERTYEQCVLLVRYFNEQIPLMLAEPDNDQLWSPDFVKRMRMANSISLGGHAMAEAIIDKFGLDRLLAVRSSVPGFLETYQELALQNAQPLPRVGARGHDYHESLPPLEPDVYMALLDILQRHFPESGGS